MDGYWGLNTTRALQQFLNSQRLVDGRQGDWEAVSVDSIFGPKTITALQMFLNREHHMLKRTCSDDVSLRANAPKGLTISSKTHSKGMGREGAASGAAVGRGSGAGDKAGAGGKTALTTAQVHKILSLWTQVPVDGEWKMNRATKIAFQAYLKYTLGAHMLEIDGKFHARSVGALQVLLAQNEWYRPSQDNTAQGTVHLSRVNQHSFLLHQWCRALQEHLSSNAAFVFYKVREGAADRIRSTDAVAVLLPFFGVD